MKMFILGFLTMSVFSFLALLLFDNQKEEAGAILSGPVTWVVLTTSFIYRVLRMYFRFRNVRSLLICPDGKIRYIHDKKADTMSGCDKVDYDYPDFDDHPEWDMNDWAKPFRNELFKCGNVRYAPKKIWSQYEPISKEEYNYAKECEREEED